MIELKIKSLKPSKYRLLKKKNGGVVLQGAFPYKGIDEQGKEIKDILWEDIPTMIEEEI